MRRLAVGLLTGAALFAAGVVVGRGTADAGAAVVPQLVGMRQSEAECRLQEMGARWMTDLQQARTSSELACADVAPDPRVRHQTPEPGTEIEPGDLVVILTECRTKQCL